MKGKIFVLILILILILAGGAYFLYVWQGKKASQGPVAAADTSTAANTNESTSVNPAAVPFTTTQMGKIESDYVRNVSVIVGEALRAGQVVRGEARGTWFFEASFPVAVKDANGAVVGTGIAQADGDWMTEDFVPFTFTVPTFTSTTTTGFLVLKNDNPSGDPANDKEIAIPVVF